MQPAEYKLSSGVKVSPTEEGYRLEVEGKTYFVTYRQLLQEKNSDLRASLGFLNFRYLLESTSPKKVESKKAFLYHNAKEAGVTWPSGLKEEP